MYIVTVLDPDGELEYSNINTAALQAERRTHSSRSNCFEPDVSSRLMLHESTGLLLSAIIKGTPLYQAKPIIAKLRSDQRFRRTAGLSYSTNP